MGSDIQQKEEKIPQEIIAATIRLTQSCGWTAEAINVPTVTLYGYTVTKNRGRGFTRQEAIENLTDRLKKNLVQLREFHTELNDAIITIKEFLKLNPKVDINVSALIRMEQKGDDDTIAVFVEVNKDKCKQEIEQVCQKVTSIVGRIYTAEIKVKNLDALAALDCVSIIEASLPLKMHGR